MLENVRHMKFKEQGTILKTQKEKTITTKKKNKKKQVFIEKRIEKAFAFPQEQLKIEKLKNNDEILPFVSTYNHNNSNLLPKLREMYGKLQISKTLGKTFTQHKLIDCQRQPSCLRRLLCS